MHIWVLLARGRLQHAAPICLLTRKSICWGRDTISLAEDQLPRRQLSVDYAVEGFVALHRFQDRTFARWSALTAGSRQERLNNQTFLDERGCLPEAEWPSSQTFI